MNLKAARDLQETMNVLAGKHMLKHATAEVKASGDEGTVVAIVSTFGPPPDLDGDVIDPHAFDETIAHAYMTGKFPGVWFGHLYTDPMNALGQIVAMTATDKQLVIEAKLDLTSERARDVFARLKSGALREWSIAYGVIKARKEADYNVLLQLELLERSVVYAGANRFTETISTKSHHPELAAINARITAAAKGAPTNPDLVDEFMRSERARAAQERADAERIAHVAEANDVRARMMSEMSLQEFESAVEQRDADAYQRFQAEMHARDAERNAEAAERDEVDERRRIQNLTDFAAGLSGGM
jgi:HK97 family phage prohead protease